MDDVSRASYVRNHGLSWRDEHKNAGVLQEAEHRVVDAILQELPICPVSFPEKNEGMATERLFRRVGRGAVRMRVIGVHGEEIVLAVCTTDYVDPGDATE